MVVEEKLDGMNVVVWIDGGIPRVGTRGGADTSDPSGERGRLRQWVSMHADELAGGLGSDFVLYGEWLRRRHAVPYIRLPAEFAAFDVLDRSTQRFLGVDDRNRLLARIGVPGPPERFRGILGSLERLDLLLGRSAFADVRAAGLVIRTAEGSNPRIETRGPDLVADRRDTVGWDEPAGLAAGNGLEPRIRAGAPLTATQREAGLRRAPGAP